MSDYTITAVMDDTGYTTRVTARHHKLIVDEPKDKGGADEGPGPFETLIAALAGCTAATLRYYADRKKIPLGGVTLEVSLHRREPSELAAAGPGAKTTVIHKRLKFADSVPQDVRPRLLEIAEKCPVNKTLIEGCEIHHAEA